MALRIPLKLWPRLMPLLDQALDLPASERTQWLSTLQDVDGDTLAALQQLVAEREALDAEGFLARGPALSDAPALAAERGEPAPAGGAQQLGFFAGDLLGPYRLLRELGQGGMSVVWLAERHDGQLRRQVALKVPHAGPGQAALAERLKRERDILAGLAHPHIARLYDVGVTPQGLPFLALEYIEGQTLLAHCESHRLGLRDRLKLFLQVLSAVQHAHTQLVLHRDLKPGNILVNAQGEVKLLDFGIAKLLQGDGTGAASSTELTQHHGHVLTPDYAAPEQIAGAPLTTASDVYALGVILFELLTGQRPYRLPRGTRGALEEAILAAEPRRPSQVWREADVQTHHVAPVTVADLAQAFGSSPRRLQQALQGDLDVIVATALQKQSQRRYATAEAFAQDIRHHLAHEPITAQPDSHWYRARKYVQRHAWALSAVAAVVSALSVGLGVALWQAQAARHEAAKANAIKDFLIGLFENGDVEQPDALLKRQQTVEQLLAHSAQALSTELKDQPAVRADLQGVLGGLLHNLSIGDAAIAVRQDRVKQLQAMDAPVAELAQAWRDLAESQDQRGDTAGSARSVVSGLAGCPATPDGTVPCESLKVKQAAAWALAGRLEPALARVEEALVVLRQRAPRSEALAQALVVKGDILSTQNQPEQSYRLYQDALALRSTLWGAHSVRLAKERYQLALGLWSVRRLSQADEQLTQAWHTMRKALGPEHTSTLVIELHLGRLMVSRENAPQGHAHIAHAAGALLQRRAELDPRTVFDVASAQGEAALSDGRLAEAEPHLRLALALSQRLRQQLPDDGAAEARLAWYLQDTGQYEEAQHVLQGAYARLRTSLGDDHPTLAYLAEALAGVALFKGSLDEAWSLLRQGQGTQDSLETQFGSFKHQVSSAQVAVLLAKGQAQLAQPSVLALYQRMRATAASEQYLATRFSATEQMGRVHSALGRCDLALPYFEEALALMRNGNRHNPRVAVTRARHGHCLAVLGRLAQAREQANQAAQALATHPRLSPYFWRPVQDLKAELVGRPRTGLTGKT